MFINYHIVIIKFNLQPKIFTSQLAIFVRNITDDKLKLFEYKYYYK